MDEQEVIEYINSVFNDYFGDRCVSNTNKFAIAQYMATEALEKQISKQVIHHHHCPQCDTGLPATGISEDYCECCFKFKHCPNCGQALKWE